MKGKTVLDVGCVDHNLANRGRSRWLHGVLRESACHVTGLDCHAPSVRQLQDEGYDTVCGDAMNFALGKRFDVIVAGEFLEHLPNPAGFLACAHQHLLPGGILVLTTPNALGLIYALQNLVLGHEVDNPSHVCFFTPRTIDELLRSCGFKVTRTVFIAGFTPMGHDSVSAQVAAWIKNVCKFPVYALRPSLCHRFLTVATPVFSDSAKAT